MTHHYLACDLGAESGRLMLGQLEGERLSLTELHRFPNVPVRASGSIHWDIASLWRELEAGLKIAGRLGHRIASISTDSWGVDYVLLDAVGRRIEPSFHYRDPRTARGVARMKADPGWETIFAETGIQFMPLNTLFQLAAEAPARLESADRLLTIGDAFNYWLSGVAVAEESNASTTQLYNPRTRSWSQRLVRAAEVPERILPRIVPSGTRLGPLRSALAAETGLDGVEVVASCTHDTAAAVAGVPADGTEGDWAYISSGTWSLMGVETHAPIIHPGSREANFTNEVGYGGSIRLLKNISGMWLLQECRRRWKADGLDPDYGELVTLAQAEPAFRSLINPTEARFLAPDDMPAAIAAYCRETGQPAPGSPGAFARCILESLALLYRRTLRQVEGLTGRRVNRVHIVGGGSRNALLNQFAANALQVPILTGPTEATAAGNIIVQAIAMGHLPSLAAGRAVVRSSFATGTVPPADGSAWDREYARFETLPG